MTVVAMLSAKGSPGVTTTAAALAAAAVAQGSHATLVELDPAGGTLALDAQRPLEPGLFTLLAAARRGLDPKLVDLHCQTLPNGVVALFAPTAPERAQKAVATLAEPLASVLRARDGLTLVDLGRWEDVCTAPILAAADLAIVMLRPTVAGTEHARTRLGAITAINPRTRVVCVGDDPYSPSEVAAALGVDPQPSVAFDARTAHLVAGGVALDRWLRRTSLMRSAAALLLHLTATTAVGVSA